MVEPDIRKELYDQAKIYRIEIPTFILYADQQNMARA